MGKIAFIYPGQGAQKVGMGKDFYESETDARKVFDEADDVLDINIKDICFEENELINNTKYTQAALVTTCLAITREVVKLGVTPNVTAGLSLGEYAAIVAAGGMTEKDAIVAVRKRGIFMDEAVPADNPEKAGAMAAVLGMETETIEKLISDIDDADIANYNCPGQIVITGLKPAVEKASKVLSENGAKRVIELNVSGPFHSKFLKPAGEKMNRELENVQLKELKVPYVTNVTGEVVNNISETKEFLVKQISSPVKWEQSIRNMINNGVDTFLEIGPGKTLTGFIRKIDRNVKCINISTVSDLEKLKNFK